jgi:hypothetical protein
VDGVDDLGRVDPVEIDRRHAEVDVAELALLLAGAFRAVGRRAEALDHAWTSGPRFLWFLLHLLPLAAISAAGGQQAADMTGTLTVK